MKYLSLLLFFLFSLSSFADTQERKTTFDFTNPQSLYPSIIPGTNAGDEVSVTDKTFCPGINDQSVKLSFIKGDIKVGASVATSNEYYNYVTFLYVSRTTKLVFDGGNNYITSIHFKGLNVGDILPTTEGNYDVHSMTWTDNNSVPSNHRVEFEVDGESWPKLTHIEITYQKPMDTLVPTDFSIADGSSIYSFKDFAVTMSLPLKEYNKSNPIIIKGQNWIPEQEVSVAIDGNVATLSVPAEIVKPIDKDVDVLDVTIPAGALVAEDGTYNKALHYSFKLVRKVDSFVFTSISPEQGKIESLQNIDLTFPTACHIDAQDKDVYLYKNGTQVDKMKVEKTDNNVVRLSTEFAYTEPAIYEVKLPKCLICDFNYDANASDKGLSKNMTYNPETTLRYNVGNYMTAEDSLKLKQPVFDAIAKRDAAVKKAKDYIALVGVGYPAADAVSRTNLQASLDANPVQETYDVSIDDIDGQVTSWNDKTTAIESAITPFVAESNVAMPSVGKYYTIANVAKDGSKLYLAYDKGAVSLTSKASKAMAFLYEKQEDGNFTFATPDHAYLHVLKPDTEEANAYQFTNANSVTKTYDKDVNGLAVAKFAAEGVDAADVFGLMSIHGTIGYILEGKNNVPKPGYSTVNTAEQVAYLDKDNKASFTDGLSSAFIFTESEKPDDIIPEVEYALTPASGTTVESLTTVTIAFDNISDVTCNKESVVLTKSGSETGVTPVSVDRSDDGKTFTFHFKNVENGTYTLVMKNDAFTYQFKDKTVTVDEITSTITVTKGYDFIYNYNDGSASMGQYLGSKTGNLIDFPIEQIGILGLSQQYGHINIDGTKTIQLVEYPSGNLVLTGHFDVENLQNVYMSDGKTLVECIAWFKPDTEIDYSKLDRIHYQYVIPAATYGDANFGKYLKDNNSVSKSDCRVNGKYVIDVYIDNNATGIDTIESEKNVVIYDMMGRRVSKITKAGVYIINGKKYIKK